MKFKITLMTLIFTISAILAMEHREVKKLKVEYKAPCQPMLFEPPSLKFLAAWNIASGRTIAKEEAPEEVLDFANKIKSIKLCVEHGDCSAEEQKFFINFLNSPDITLCKIQEHFPTLVRTYLERKKFTDVKQLFDNMLIIAVDENKPTLVQLLVDFGSDVNAHVNFEGDTVLRLASNRNYKEIVKILLDKAADVNLANKSGNTPLMAAAQDGFTEIAAILLNHNINIDSIRHDGATALLLAACKGHKEIVQMLVDKGTNIDAQDNGGVTALMWAAAKGHNEIVQILLNAGADVNHQDKRGDTSLVGATEGNYKKIVRILLNYGANANMRNKAGHRALWFAEDQDIRQMLEHSVS